LQKKADNLNKIIFASAIVTMMLTANPLLIGPAGADPRIAGNGGSDFTAKKTLVDLKDSAADFDAMDADADDQPSMLDSLIAYSSNFIGIPYKKSGSTRKGFDCSGFVRYVFSKFGIELPRCSRNMYVTTDHAVGYSDAKKGDLVFFRGKNRAKAVHHVGIVVSEAGEPLQFIHSSCSRGIHITMLSKSRYFLSRFLGIGRVASL
jgi:cell wall-associated NlpC family hydrolase